MFKINESNMEGLKRAGCDAHLLIRIMRLIRSTKDSVEKIELFNDYIDKLIRQHLGSMMNNDMRSTNAQFAAKYIDQVCVCVCVCMCVHVYWNWKAEICVSSLCRSGGMCAGHFESS